MKRKGFTLVELLIIVAIIGALSATMMVSSGSSITKAKAAAIANNLRVCTSGAQLFYLKHADDESGSGLSVTTKAMLTEAVPNFDDFNVDGTIKYEADDSDTGQDKWSVTVTLSGNEASEIMSSLQAIKGFSKASGTSVTYKVFTGVVGATDDDSGDDDDDGNG